MKHFCLTICCFVSLNIFCYAQEELKGVKERKDSLIALLATLPEDTSKLSTLQELSDLYFYNSEEDMSILIGEEFYELASRLNSKDGLEEYYSDIYSQYFFYNEALFKIRHKEAVDYFQKQRDTIGIINSKLTESHYLSEKGKDFDEAIILLEEAIKLSLNIGFVEGEAIAYELLLGLMHYTDNEKEVIYYADKLLAIDGIDLYYKGIALYYKGSELLNMNQLDSIAHLLNQALKISIEIGDKLSVQKTYSALGEYYIQVDSIKKAKHYLRKAENLAETIQCACTTLGNTFGVLGSYYFDQEQYDTAKIYLEKAILRTDIEKQENPGSELYLFPTYKELSSIYEKEGNYEAALNHFKQYHIYKDSTNTLFNNKTIEEFNIKYETQEKEKAIALLTARNQTYRVAVGSIGLLALLTTSFFLYVRRKNQLITQQKSDLEQLNTTKDRLFAIISHDLRKPALAFRGISKKVKFLIQQQEFETLDKYGASLEKAAYSLNGLLDNLLNWALQQRDVLPYNPAPINVAEVTEEIYGLFNQMAADKNIHLKMSIPESTLIFADLNAYATIVRNLIDNAIKYTPEGGLIDLSAEKVAEKIAIKVADTGTGISPEKIKQLFDLQQNKSSQGTAGEMGAGLGLSLVKDLVALNKGTIKVESVMAKGTTFEVLLPAA